MNLKLYKMQLNEIIILLTGQTVWQAVAVYSAQKPSGQSDFAD